MAALYSLTRGDKAIFDLYKKTGNPNVISDYYLRSETSGTWWLPGAETKKWESGYKKLYTKWKQKREPEKFDMSGNTYQVRWEHEKAREFPEMPAFFHNHGSLFLPYQQELHEDRTPIRTIIGGFGSGKTLGQCQSMLVHGLSLVQFRAFALAPLSIQAQEFYELIMNMISGTIFEDRFLISAPQKPFPKIVFGHKDVGECKIECYPIAGNEAKLRTLTGDLAVIDQAEHPQLDLPEIRRSIGTRFRGRISRNGRERIGTLTFLANAGDKQELWDQFDEADEDPENYKSMSPSSYDNIWLTDRDIKRFELQVGQTEESKDVYLRGARPLGNGEHFSRAVLEAMRDTSLDAEMDRGLLLQENHDKNYGFVKMEGKNVATFEWLLPYKKDHEYLVMSDPGTKNPPNRDSPAIMVWDITDFPGPLDNPKPATMAGFVWVYGNNNINTWVTRFSEIVWRYKAIGKCGFDATGYQSGYEVWMPTLTNLFVEKMNLAGNGKSMMLNAAKILTAREMLRAPAAISHLYQQLSRYEYPPEPRKLRQDLVMTFIMCAWWLQRMYWMENDPANNPLTPGIEDRYPVDEVTRYGMNSR